MIRASRLAPGEVFTPRPPDVNRDMYVSRRGLERQLRRAVNGTQHIIVFGESGSGKTWLYREYFKSHNIASRVIDLSVALTEGLQEAIFKSLPEAKWKPVRRTISGKAGADLYAAKIGGDIKTEYEAEEVRPLDALLADLQSDDATKRFVVFDNFEQVSNRPDLLAEISSLIIRLDTPTFASYGARFLFVGVVSDMKELIAHYEQAGTVANRITEIPEVERLAPSEARSLVRRGFFDKLRVKCENEDNLIDRVLFLTDRNAQQLHELCYEIACEAEENEWRIDGPGIERAETDWVNTSLSHYRALIEARMNKRETKIQRRNQVLFCLGATDSSSIRASDIDTLVRKIFPRSVQAEQLGIDQILASLADTPNPILIKNPNSPSYRISHPKLKPAIRVILAELAPDDRQASIGSEELLHKLLKSIRELEEVFKEKGP